MCLTTEPLQGQNDVDQWAYYSAHVRQPRVVTSLCDRSVFSHAPASSSSRSIRNLQELQAASSHRKDLGRSIKDGRR